MDSTRLKPRDSGKFIASKSENVSILEDGVRKAARLILNAVKDGSMEKVQFAAQDVHPKGGGTKAVDWVFLLDTINFSFWPDEGKSYEVLWKEKKYTGYFAACAAVNKALEKGIPVTSAEWMAKASLQDLEEIFRSDTPPFAMIPLFEERQKAINDSGKVLLEKFDGSFHNVVKKCDQSAQTLLQLIVENFVSFRDFAEFHGQKISLLKRAQILVLDVFGALEGHPEANFGDIDSLTMFADYRVPQAMAFLEVLKYSDQLLEKLKKKGRLMAAGDEEIELRGCSIEACERIVASIEELRVNEEEYQHCRKVTSADVDVFLWMYRRAHAEKVEEAVPMHRTRTIYY
ncbi:unnamed protein product, partial [Mesorhabditis belari]|uniref:Queuosine 5'-phosphate N-glycosylase/hydrolase n=1 Tax=Mesorhabditis belari TaxID=2138241 RepID=A0AAF3F0P4_9BILA